MEPVRNNADPGTPLAVLTADFGRLDHKLDDRVGKPDERVGTLETRIGGLDVRIGKLEVRVDELVLNMREVGARLGALTERVVKVETAIDFVRTDVKNLNDNVSAIRTTDFRLMFGALIAVVLGLSAMMAKGFGWL